jgi:hypothetical protein
MRNPTADAAENAGGVGIALSMPRVDMPLMMQQMLGMADKGPRRMCAACVRQETIWGQLTPQA